MPTIPTTSSEVGPGHTRPVAPPAVLLWLGRAGLLPFLLLPVAGWGGLLPTDWVTRAFTAYSLAILCFLAGTLWGTSRDLRGTEKDRRLLYSNAFVLAAVGAVVFLPAAATIGVLLVTHLVLTAYEQSSATQGGWYLRFRWQLTLVASACHLLLIPLVV